MQIFQKLKTISQIWKLNQGIQWRFFSQDDGKNDNKNNEQKNYIHSVNYNREQFKYYQKKIEAVQKEKLQRQIDIQNDPELLKPRRKRRIYNAPKHDRDISNYSAWRVFDRNLFEQNQITLPCVCKIECSPQQLINTFGIGEKYEFDFGQHFNSITRYYRFEDDNLDLFHIYDWRQTTTFWGQNLENYDYKNQEHLEPRKRKREYPSEEDFWNSNEKVQFRIKCTNYADFIKFKAWVEDQIKKTEESGITWEQKVIQNYRQLDTFDNFEKEYKLDQEPTVFQINHDYWKQEIKKENKKDKKDAVKQDQQTPESGLPKIVPAKKLDDQYKIIQKN